MFPSFSSILITISLLLLSPEAIVAWSPSQSFSARPSISPLVARRTLVTPLRQGLKFSVRSRSKLAAPLTVVYQSTGNIVDDSKSPLMVVRSTSASSETVIADAPADSSLLAASANTQETQKGFAEHFAEMDYEEILRKSVNAVLLVSCFSYAAYFIFNMDANMSRGWTQSEVAMRTTLDTWSSYETSLADNPVFTKTLINVIIYLLGDWLSQTVFQGKNVLDFDSGRTLRNGFIGLCFGPLVHEYYEFSDRILPVEGGMWNRIQKILMDQTIYLTVKCGIYIAAVGLLQGDDWDTVKTNVKEKLGGIVFTAWKFWPLVHMVTYNVIPGRHRILWVNCVDLVWNAILATMSQKKEGVVVEEPDYQVTDQFRLEDDNLELQMAHGTLFEETVFQKNNTDTNPNFVESSGSSGNSTGNVLSYENVLP
jgi:protein Mpv17